MIRRVITIALTAAALLMAAGNHSFAEEKKTKAPTKNRAAHTAVKKYRKTAAGKPVDINSAGKEALKKLPGITDAYADKIIAGRPYASKARLVTDNVIPEGVFGAIRGSIIAKQPFNDGAKNAAIYSKKNSKN
jgi:DNA uptake protein ComE-like DNA-binding protein